MNNEIVLVTGGTGFIAQHCILALLKRGYRVRTTVRSLDREAEVRQQVSRGGVEAKENLEFVVADLMSNAGWDQALAGCRYVMHGASPTPSGDQVKESDWVVPAIDGNLRVLRAARNAGVKRVVLTSAFGAIGVGHPVDYPRPFNENDWSDVNGDIWPYQKSKTLSERAAWSFIEKEGNGLELSAVNPVAVMGPVLGADYSHSTRIIKNMLEGGLGCPDINSCYVDVRDVADLHVLAMTHPAANGERFLASAGKSMTLLQVAQTLSEHLGDDARKVSTEILTDEMVRAAAHNNPVMQGMVKLLGVDMNATSVKAISQLGWKPRSPQEAIIATANSLIALGLVNNK
ncbi:aldehyde reductase [Enterobacteriaceae bacterium 89]|nr:aldehyde reductase [Enterobacteriaceae bacterium 89]